MALVHVNRILGMMLVQLFCWQVRENADGVFLKCHYLKSAKLTEFNRSCVIGKLLIIF